MLRLVSGQLARQAQRILPPNVRHTLRLYHFGLRHVPLIVYCAPRVLRLDAGGCALTIPLRWRTRNHYKSMYFGAFAVGADCACGLLAQHLIDASRAPVQLLFKDFHATFMRRALGDVAFACDEGARVAALVAHAAAAPERVEAPVTVVARVPSMGQEVVARFVLTLSLKQAATTRR